MNDKDYGEKNRTKARGSRSAPVIDLSASEIPQNEAAQTVIATPVEPEKIAVETKPPDAKSVETETVEEKSPEVIPPAKSSRTSLFLPMSFAAIVGGILGTIGGTVVPSFLGSGATAPNPEVQQLKQQISALAAKPATVSPETEALRQKLHGLEGDIAKRLIEAENKLSGRIQGIEGDVKTLTARPAGSSAAPVDLSPLTQRLGALEQDFKTVESKTDPKIAAIAQQVEQATKRMTASNSAPFFASVQGLAQAFNAGVPFATELTAVELLGGKADALAPLRSLAPTGAPTLTQINARFAPLAAKLAQGEIKSENWAMSVLEKFAKVRPVGQIGGTTPADIVSTIEAALAKGDVPAALAAWRRLPEPARIASNEWAASAETRDKAAKALSAMQEAAITALRMAKP